MPNGAGHVRSVHLGGGDFGPGVDRRHLQGWARLREVGRYRGGRHRPRGAAPPLVGWERPIARGPEPRAGILHSPHAACQLRAPGYQHRGGRLMPGRLQRHHQAHRRLRAGGAVHLAPCGRGGERGRAAPHAQSRAHPSAPMSEPHTGTRCRSRCSARASCPRPPQGAAAPSHRSPCAAPPPSNRTTRPRRRDRRPPPGRSPSPPAPPVIPRRAPHGGGAEAAPRPPDWRATAPPCSRAAASAASP